MVLLTAAVFSLWRMLACSFATRSSNSEPITVGAYYYGWWGVGGSLRTHWESGYVRRDLSPPQEPLLGEYSQSNMTVINQHLQWVSAYNISLLIFSWWGPDDSVERTLQNLFKSPQLGNTQVGIFYESYEILGSKAEHRDVVYFDAEGTVEQKMIKHFQYIAENHFSHANYPKIQGKPVVYLYTTRIFTGYYHRAIKNLRKTIFDQFGYEMYLVADEIYWRNPNLKRIALFDAITAYNMYGPSCYAGYVEGTSYLQDVELTYSIYQTAAGRLGVDLIPGIIPFYNDRGVRLETDHYVIPEEISARLTGSGQFSTFGEMLKLARRVLSTSYVKQSQNLVMITSFNEWHEDTCLEPTKYNNVPTANEPFLYSQGFSYRPTGFKLLEKLSDFVTTTNAGTNKVPRRSNIVIGCPTRAETMTSTILGIFWILQPLFMYFFIINHSRTRNTVGLFLYLCVTTFLADALHMTQEPGDGSSCVIWVVFTIITARYVHAVAVGGVAFASHYGLTTFPRVVLFTLSVPTLIFAPASGSKRLDPRNSKQLLLWKSSTAILYLAVVYVYVFSVPTRLAGCKIRKLSGKWAAQILYMYVLAMTEDICNLLFEIPTRFLLTVLGQDQDATIISNYDNPVLTMSPRDLWRRWSISIAYPLRHGVYELAISSGRLSRNQATLLCFVVSCAVHILCVGYWMQNDGNHVGWMLLLAVFPMLTIAMQDKIPHPKVEVKGKEKRGLFALSLNFWHSTRQYKVYCFCNYLNLAVSLVLLQPIISATLPVPATLHDFSTKVMKYTNFNAER